MPKTELFTITLRNHTTEQVQGTRLREHWFYHKRDNRYWLTHEPTGLFLASAPTVKALRELINEPEFFQEDITKLADAVSRWNNKIGWK